MKQYLLLRDNQQSGPYNLEQISELSLKKLDLVWIEGQSTQWEYASEVDELKASIIKEKTNNPVYYPPVTAERIRTKDFKYKPYVELPVTEKKTENRAAISTTIPEGELEIKFEQPLSEIKERYVKHLEQEKFQFGNQLQRNSGVWIMALMFMLIASAFVIKKIVDNNSDEIKEKTPVAAAVPLVGLPEGKVAEKPADVSYQNAISVEDAPATTVVEKKTIKKISLKEIRKKVTIRTNNYKVRMFGGVDDLQLNVHNGSSVTLDKINVQVLFLKPNGEEVKSDSYSVYSVAPGETKILVVPPSKRGVKVKPVITGIESRQPAIAAI
jgi:hypothetical protein